LVLKFQGAAHHFGQLETIMADTRTEKAPEDLEYTKWKEDIRLREQEIELKEREQRSRDQELAVKRTEFERSRWSSPIVLAVLAAAIAGLGNAGVAWLNGYDQRRIENDRAGTTRTLEESRSEAARILEVIKTNDPDKAAINLGFLLDTGLISDAKTRNQLQAYLDKRIRGQGPALPTGVPAEGTPVGGPGARVALVIGNERYPNLPVDRQKALNDARAIADTLQKLGFAVIRGENLDRRGMINQFVEFSQRVRQGDMALLFYAGHSALIAGSNYLIPTDMPLLQPNERGLVDFRAIRLDLMIAEIRARKARTIVLFIDSCRDPFLHPGAGIGCILEEHEGVFALYSASEGQTPLERLGDTDDSPNSVFTRVLVRALGRSDQHLLELASDVRREVAQLARSVGHVQLPPYSDFTLGGRVYLGDRR
jgi:hypothetical protein